MKTTSVDPQQVMVTAAIDFHTALQAIQEYATKYPIERVSRDQARAITRAGLLLHQRLEDSRRDGLLLHSKPEETLANATGKTEEVSFVHRGKDYHLELPDWHDAP